MKALLNENVKPAIHLEAECLADWYKMAQTIFLQTQILEKDLTSYEESIFEAKDRLCRIKEELKSESVDPKKNVSSMFKESSMAVRKRLEVSNNVKVKNFVEFSNTIMKTKKTIFIHPQNILEYEKDIKLVLAENAELIKMLQNVNLDDCNSIENSHL